MLTPKTPTDFGTSTRPGETVGFTSGGFRDFGNISWSAIFAGAVIALATQLVLTLIGAAIGLATLDPATGDNPSGAALGIGAGIWLLVSSIISLFIGGYIAARLAGTRNGWLHGLTTWGIVTLLTAVLLSTAVGSLIGTASGLANFANSTGAGADVRRATRQTIDRTRATTTEQQARETADAAAKSTAAGTGGAALGLILGAVAAALGGKFAEKHLGRYNRAEETFTPSPATTRH